jgi:hypothetical protein
VNRKVLNCWRWFFCDSFYHISSKCCCLLTNLCH